MERLVEGGRLDANGALAQEVLADHVGGEADCASGVLLFREAIEIGGEPDLGFDLFLAIAEVVVGDDRDNHAGGVAGSDLEGLPVVVELVFTGPAHAVALLAVGGLVNVGETEIAFSYLREVRGEDDATGVTGPMGRVEGGVVFWEIG